jgi:glycosyltransferase involved in cell wall biosynthesis
MSANLMTGLAPRPPRVLHILEATLGGTLRYLENIAEATSGLDIVPAFAYGGERADSRLTPFLHRISKLGWGCYAVDMVREVRPLSDLKAWFQLRRVINDFVPDIIHCHSSKAGALGRTSCFMHRVHPTRVYSPHALAAPLGSIYLTIERLLAKSTERFIAVSDSERKEIVDYSLAAKDSVSVVYPTVDVDHFSPSSQEAARRALGLDPRPLIIGIGRLTAQKDPLTFVDIIARVHEQRPDIHARWIGSGDLTCEFHTRVRAQRLERVIRIVPWQHDVRLYIAAADVLLSTSRFESFGYVAAEALAMNRPVVASDINGTRDIMQHSLAEWLYPLDSAELAATLILKLLDDPVLASTTGTLGRSRIKECFGVERMRESLTQAYGALLNHSAPVLSKEAFTT